MIWMDSILLKSCLFFFLTCSGSSFDLDSLSKLPGYFICCWPILFYLGEFRIVLELFIPSSWFFNPCISSMSFASHWPDTIGGGISPRCCDAVRGWVSGGIPFMPLSLSFMITLLLPITKSLLLSDMRSWIYVMKASPPNFYERLKFLKSLLLSRFIRDSF